MRLFLLLALVVIVAIVLISMRESGPRITRIERRREEEDDE